MLNTTQKKFQSALVIGNATEVVTGVIREIAGNDISTHLNGSRVTTDIIASLVAQRMSHNFNRPAKSL